MKKNYEFNFLSCNFVVVDLQLFILIDYIHLNILNNKARK